MLDTNLIATVMMTVGLLGGAMLALWQLPWSEADLRQTGRDVKDAADRLTDGAQPHERRFARVHAR